MLNTVNRELCNTYSCIKNTLWLLSHPFSSLTQVNPGKSHAHTGSSSISTYFMVSHMQVFPKWPLEHMLIFTANNCCIRKYSVSGPADIFFFSDSIYYLLFLFLDFLHLSPIYLVTGYFLIPSPFAYNLIFPFWVFHNSICCFRMTWGWHVYWLTNLKFSFVS